MNQQASEYIETKAKRREEMKMILQAGYKSRELYRKDQASE